MADRVSGTRKALWGGMSSGKVQAAEMLSFIQALAWYDDNAAPAARARLGRQVLKVRIISDNKNTVDQGNRNAQRQKMLPLWAYFTGITRLGYDPVFHYQPRNKLALHSLADHLSRECRIALEGMSVGKVAPGVDVYELNPGAI